MAPSHAANNAIGAIGGGVLAACLMPQLWKLWRTRSAGDLSYLYIILYNIGLLFTFIYLYYEEAVAGWITMLIELACCMLLFASKIFLDLFGPHRRRGGIKGAHVELPSNPFLTGDTFLDMEEGAPSEGITPPQGPQHLLLDIQLNPVPATAAAGADGPHGGSSSASLGGSNGVDGTTAVPGVAHRVGEMLEAALSAAGLTAPRQQQQQQLAPDLPCGLLQWQSDPWATSRGAAEDVGAATGQDALHRLPELLFVPCRGGYAAATFHPAATALSIDLLASSDAAVVPMRQAAQAFCTQLSEKWPAARIQGRSVAAGLPQC